MANVKDEELKQLVEGYEKLPEEARFILMTNVNVLLASEQMKKGLPTPSQCHDNMSR